MSRFVYYNREPNNQRQSDCVTRAISLASNLPYSEIRKKLFYTAKLLNCEKLCTYCYKHLIEDVFKYRRVNCDFMTVGEFADKNPIGIFLVRMEQHISVIINNTIYDTWDCRNEFVTDAWKVKE